MNYIERLTGLREDKDLKQDDIAKLLGTTQTAISKYELGQRQYKIQDLIKLCLFYGLSADYILDLPTTLKDPRKGK